MITNKGGCCQGEDSYSSVIMLMRAAAAATTASAIATTSVFGRKPKVLMAKNTSTRLKRAKKLRSCQNGNLKLAKAKFFFDVLLFYCFFSRSLLLLFLLLLLLLLVLLFLLLLFLGNGLVGDNDLCKGTTTCSGTLLQETQQEGKSAYKGNDSSPICYLDTLVKIGLVP